MANPNPSVATRFQPGQSGNPLGKPAASRHRLQKTFLNALAKDFDAHGVEAITRMREEKPAEYIKCIVALMPKEVEIKNGLDELNDEQLDAALIAARALLDARATGATARARASKAQEPESA